MPAQWQSFADTKRNGLTTRRAGALVEVNHTLAWRWRRRVISFLVPTTPPRLSGLADADETYLHRKYNDSTPVGRHSSRRGSKNGRRRGLGTDKAPVVVVARARCGEMRTVVLSGTPTAAASTNVFRL